MAGSDYKKPSEEQEVELELPADELDQKNTADSNVPASEAPTIPPTAVKSLIEKTDPGFGMGQDYLELPLASRSISLEESFQRPLAKRREERKPDTSIPHTSAADIAKAIDSSTSRSSFGWYIVLAAVFLAVFFFGHRFHSKSQKQKALEGRTAAIGSSFPSSMEEVNLAQETMQHSGSFPSTQASSSEGTAQIELVTDVVGYQLFVNGRSVTALDDRFEIPAGASTIELRRMGYETFKATVNAKDGEVKTIKPIFAKELSKGYLSYETLPESKLTLYQGDKVILEKNTPFRGVSLPAGTYRAVLENELIGYRSEEEIVVVEWKTTTLRREIKN